MRVNFHFLNAQHKETTLVRTFENGLPIMPRINETITMLPDDEHFVLHQDGEVQTTFWQVKMITHLFRGRNQTTTNVWLAPLIDAEAGDEQ